MIVSDEKLNQRRIIPKKRKDKRKLGLIRSCSTASTLAIKNFSGFMVSDEWCNKKQSTTHYRLLGASSSSSQAAVSLSIGKATLVEVGTIFRAHGGSRPAAYGLPCRSGGHGLAEVDALHFGKEVEEMKQSLHPLGGRSKIHTRQHQVSQRPSNSRPHASVSDFGMMPLMNTPSTLSRSNGHDAPEITNSRKITHKSDVQRMREPTAIYFLCFSGSEMMFSGGLRD
ncbi:putative inactive receptor kinase [Senna tora]|uniref:Putative inactive receptor kinase n=1 Tax=Senna tora TaxID=362788 RepID=A0A834X7W6_9FABA|nr:putative inactive receptor kinase [Senna tora]